MQEPIARVDLEAYLSAFVADTGGGGSYRVLSEYQQEFPALISCVTRTRRCVGAYLSLVDVGYVAEAEALVRIAIEHAAYAQWAFLTESGQTQLQASMNHTNVGILRALHKMSPDKETLTLIEEAKAQNSNAERLPSVSADNGILALTGERILLMTYRLFSQRMHVGYKTLVDALHRSSDGSVGVVANPEGENHYEALYALSHCAVLANWLVARLVGDGDARHEMERLAVAWDMSYRIDLRLPQDVRRFASETG